MSQKGYPYQVPPLWRTVVEVVLGLSLVIMGVVGVAFAKSGLVSLQALVATVIVAMGFVILYFGWVDWNVYQSRRIPR